MTSKIYDNNIDYEFFVEKGVTVTQLLPWQFALTHPDCPGRFVWYPEGGSLIYELADWGVHKVGVYTDSKDIWHEIQRKFL